MKLKKLFIIVTFVLFSTNLISQEISGHFSFNVGSNYQFNGAKGFGGDYVHKIGKTRLGLTYDYSNIYKTVITNYNEEITGTFIYDNQYSNMICNEFAIFVLRNLKETDNSRIAIGPIIGINYLRRLGSIQRFYKPDDFRFYNFFRYDDKNKQSEFGLVCEAEIKEIICKNLSFLTKIKGVVSGIEYNDFSDSRNPNSFFNMKVEMGFRYSFKCKKN
jgi:hypothetical protein